MPGSSKRGFASMNPEKQRMIASKGGREAHRQGTAHEFSSEEARAAGRLSRKITGANRTRAAASGRKSR
jgi:general stress protein YciG